MCYVLSLIGLLYIGNVCIVFFNYFYVCYYGGDFVICIEDIDWKCYVEDGECF